MSWSEVKLLKDRLDAGTRALPLLIIEDVGDNLGGKTLTITNGAYTHTVGFPQGESILPITLECLGDWDISYTDNGNTVTDTVTVDKVGGVTFMFVTPVSWSSGTDEQIVAMVQAADNGIINLSDYWNVGDERTVHLSAMDTITGIDETHVAQDVELVLMDTNHFTLNTPTDSGRTTCSFVVGLKDSLIEKGKMNTNGTNVGGWDQSPRRNWCNTVFKNAIPSTLLPIFKQFKVKASAGNKSTTLVTSTDWFSLPCLSEIGLSNQYVVTGEGTTMQWYNTSSNRRKRVGTSGSLYTWWTRSPDTRWAISFFNIYPGGTVDDNSAANPTSMSGLSSFGVI